MLFVDIDAALGVWVGGGYDSQRMVRLCETVRQTSAIVVVSSPRRNSPEVLSWLANEFTKHGVPGALGTFVMK